MHLLWEFRCVGGPYAIMGLLVADDIATVIYPYCCTHGGEIWHGGGDLRFPPLRQISAPSVQRVAHALRKTSKSTFE